MAEPEKQDKFYHIHAGITGLMSLWMDKNITHKDALFNYVCPFINKEIVVLDDRIVNLSVIGSFKIYETEKQIDDDWPIKKAEHVKKDDISERLKYSSNLTEKLGEVGRDVTAEMYKEALELINSGNYSPKK